MSIVLCDNCEQQIDTDDDVDCWCIKQRNELLALCKSCRDNTDEDIRYYWETEHDGSRT